MPITVADVLRQSGMSEDEVKALDAKALKAFETVVSTAEQERDKAELAKRAQQQMYDTEIAPALDGWANEKARLEAEAAFYRTQAEAAKSGGFIPSDAPTYKPEQPRAGDGKFVPGANAVPGSPNFEQFENKVGAAIGTLADLQWQYQSLFGTHMPDSPTKLMQEANAQRLPLVDYAARKYNFEAKRTEVKAAEQKKHDDAIRAEVGAQKDREWAEKSSSNPNFRTPEASRFSRLESAVKEGQRKDPLSMSREERHMATRQEIRKDVNENAAAVA